MRAQEERGWEQDGSQSESKAEASLRGPSCPRLVWVRSESRAGLFLLGRSPSKKKDAGPHSREAEARAGAGLRGRLPGPEVWNAIKRVRAKPAGSRSG